MKIGGSLSERGNTKTLSNLGKLLEEIHQGKSYFIIIPGGGTFVEMIRNLQGEFKFTDDQAHWMAILGMAQYAQLLHHYIPNSKIIAANSKGIYKKITFDFIPILDVINFMKYSSNLKHDWNNTSDAIAVEIASKLHVKKILFIKDVDGVNINNTIQEKITAEELRKLEYSPLDKVTPELLVKYHIKSWIINGFYPERIKALIVNNSKVLGTEIIE
ncbi:MAG: hypothetical protein ACFFDW_05255 [Candidatus Thorarchaeota archaeon]